MIAFGIDPGLTGGIAVRGDGIIAAIAFTSTDGTLDFEKIQAFLRPFKEFESKAFVEAVHASPQMGVSSAFTFGRTTGHIEGYLLGQGISIARVRPQKWQAEMYSMVSSSIVGKERSLIAARVLYPQIDLRATERSHTPHTGKADALLLATYGFRSLNTAKLV